MSELLKRVIDHEGFESKPYPDPLSGGEPYTFGHGLTYITAEESLVIVEQRLVNNTNALIAIWPWLTERPQSVLEVVVEMSYQMGVRGVNNFRNMWAALQAEDYERAAAEMLDSRWARQTPGRAQSLSDIIRGLA